MKKVVLFEGKTTIGGMEVELKIFRVVEGETKYYEWDYNPHLVDVNQVDVHVGEINRGDTLEDILYRINMYKQEIRKIKEIRPQTGF